MRNFRYTARGRPHNLQRDSRRVENFGLRLAFAIFDLLAIGSVFGFRSSVFDLAFFPKTEDRSPKTLLFILQRAL